MKNFKVTTLAVSCMLALGSTQAIADQSNDVTITLLNDSANTSSNSAVATHEINLPTVAQLDNPDGTAATETPDATETPAAAEAPDATETPDTAETPDAADTQEVETPEVTTPEVETPEVETPEVETPEVETPEVETPEVEAPESP